MGKRGAEGSKRAGCEPGAARPRSLGSPVALHLLGQAKRRAGGIGQSAGGIGAGALRAAVLGMFSGSGLRWGDYPFSVRWFLGG